jgi:hypothetical protein
MRFVRAWLRKTCAAASAPAPPAILPSKRTPCESPTSAPAPAAGRPGQHAAGMQGGLAAQPGPSPAVCACASDLHVRPARPHASTHAPTHAHRHACTRMHARTHLDRERVDGVAQHCRCAGASRTGLPAGSACEGGGGRQGRGSGWVSLSAWWREGQEEVRQGAKALVVKKAATPDPVSLPPPRRAVLGR